MKAHGINIIALPMTDVPPPSDYVVAQRTAKFHELYQLLKDNDNGFWGIEQAKKNILARFNRFMAAYDRHRAAHEEWLANGKPELDRRAADTLDDYLRWKGRHDV